MLTKWQLCTEALRGLLSLTMTLLRSLLRVGGLHNVGASLAWVFKMLAKDAGYPEVEDVTVKGKRGLAALGQFMTDIEQQIAWLTGYTLRGLNLTERGDGWLIVLKLRKGGKPVVAFIGGDSVIECWRNLWLVLYKDKLKVRPDMFAK